jgi:hypothetical protein
LLFTKPLAFYLAGLALAASVVGVLSLIYGNRQRISLIYESSIRAEELIASLSQGLSDPREAYVILRQLAMYRDVLLRLAVYDEASRISGYITKYSDRYHVSIVDLQNYGEGS